MRLGPLSLLFVACLSFAQSQPSAVKTDQPQASQNPPRIDFWFIPASPDPDATEKQPASHNESHYGDVATWALVIVGIGGVIAALKTLAIIKRQTKAIEQQGDALMLADRAWLLIRPAGFQLVPSNKFDWVVVNAGRSTAKILEAQVRCRTDISYRMKLPAMPQHNQPILVYGTPIAPNGTLNFFSGFDAFDATYNEVMNAPLTQQNIDDIQKGTADLVAYGYVRYEDAFGKTHETRFCSYYTTWAKDFRINLQAPAEYHRCD